MIRKVYHCIQPCITMVEWVCCVVAQDAGLVDKCFMIRKPHPNIYLYTTLIERLIVLHCRTLRWQMSTL